jgi:hypothetical protein
MRGEQVSLKGLAHLASTTACGIVSIVWLGCVDEGMIIETQEQHRVEYGRAGLHQCRTSNLKLHCKIGQKWGAAVSGLCQQPAWQDSAEPAFGRHTM